MFPEVRVSSKKLPYLDINDNFSMYFNAKSLHMK